MFSMDHQRLMDKGQVKHSRFLDTPRAQRVRGYSCRQSLARCESPARFKNARLILLLIRNIIWITILWIGVLGKAATDSSLDIVRHYTNWIWIFSTVYWTLDTISLLKETRYMERALLFGFWWIVFPNIWVVFWLVFVMIYANPNTITDNFEENGGDYYAGAVLVGDRIYHVVPAIYSVWYFAWRMPDFVDIFNLTFGYDWRYGTDSRKDGIILYIFLMTAAAFLPFFMYYNAFDINEVYEVDTPVWVGLMILAGSIGITNVGGIVILSPIGDAIRGSFASSWNLNFTSPSPLDRVKYHQAMERKGDYGYYIPTGS